METIEQQKKTIAEIRATIETAQAQHRDRLASLKAALASAEKLLAKSEAQRASLDAWDARSPEARAVEWLSRCKGVTPASVAAAVLDAGAEALWARAGEQIEIAGRYHPGVSAALEYAPSRPEAPWLAPRAEWR